MSDIAIIFIVGFICYHLGWYNAHITVAAECDRLGGFFVGKTVYECKRKVDNE